MKKTANTIPWPDEATANLPIGVCRVCGKTWDPQTPINGVMRAYYCSPECRSSRPRTIREITSGQPCWHCGWDGPCDIHRIKSGSQGGQYEDKNVVVLCPNCHRLVHRNLISIEARP